MRALYAADFYGLARASVQFPYNREIRLRPAYLFGVPISVGEKLLATDPYSLDLSQAMMLAYQSAGDKKSYKRLQEHVFETYKFKGQAGEILGKSR